MKPEKTLTLHPQGKKGVNIDLGKYNCLKEFILETLFKKGEITFTDLFNLSIKALQPTFQGKVGWYLVSVKLDLEAREMIERIPKTSPHVVRIKK
jgi:hypothetical protein